jgi:hypothetical protein
MFRHIHRALACLMLAGLAACVSAPSIPFDHAANPGIKNIGLIQPYMSPSANVILASDIGQSFGLIGALVDAGMMANRNSKFAALLAQQGVNPPANFSGDLKAALSAHGYTVTDVPMTRDRADLLKTYPPAGANPVDAYLDVSVYNYGYIASGIGDASPYRPFVGLRCRLVRASDGAVLMEDGVAYNPVTFAGATTKAVTLSPDPAYVFVDFDTLTGKPEGAVKGLNAALVSSADAIGTLVQ